MLVGACAGDGACALVLVPVLVLPVLGVGQLG